LGIMLVLAGCRGKSDGAGTASKEPGPVTAADTPKPGGPVDARPAQAAPADPPPSVAAATRPLALTAMSGPYSTLADFCKKHPDPDKEFCGPLSEVPRDEIGTTLPLDRSMGADRKLAAPFLEARFVGIGLSSLDCRLAVRTDHGWFVQGSQSYCAMGDNRSQDSTHLDELAVRDLLPGGNPELVVEFTRKESAANLDNDGMLAEAESHELMICGGTATQISCLEPLITRYADSQEPMEDADGDAGAASHSSYQMKVEYQADAILVTGDLPASSSSLDRRGRHPVTFPK